MLVGDKCIYEGTVVVESAVMAIIRVVLKCAELIVMKKYLNIIIELRTKV